MESVSREQGHPPPRANEFLAQGHCDAQEFWGARRLPRVGIVSFAPNATPSALRPPTSCLHPSGCAEAGHKRQYADCAGRPKPPGDSSTPPVPGGNTWGRRPSHAEGSISRKNKRSTRASPLNKGPRDGHTRRSIRRSADIALRRSLSHRRPPNTRCPRPTPPKLSR